MSSVIRHRTRMCVPPAIVVKYGGKLMTVSASTKVSPAGKITLSEWGFQKAPLNGERPGDPAPVVRIYVGDH